MKAFDPDRFHDLSAAVLSDVMDTLGLMNQAMQPFVRPLDENLVLTGRARTGLYMLAYEVREGENPYEVEIALVDDLKPGDVPVLACHGPTQRIAPWGELLSTAARARGAAGCITTAWCATSVRFVRCVSRSSTAGSARSIPRPGQDGAARCAGRMRRR